MKPDLDTSINIKIMVDSFYDKIRKDELLGPIFNGIIKDWTVHLEKLYRFWETLLTDKKNLYSVAFYATY